MACFATTSILRSNWAGTETLIRLQEQFACRNESSHQSEPSRDPKLLAAAQLINTGSLRLPDEAIMFDTEALLPVEHAPFFRSSAARVPTQPEVEEPRPCFTLSMSEETAPRKRPSSVVVWQLLSRIVKWLSSRMASSCWTEPSPLLTPRAKDVSSIAAPQTLRSEASLDPAPFGPHGVPTTSPPGPGCPGLGR